MHMYINIFLAFQVSQRGFSEQVNELKGSWNTQVQTSDASPPGAVPPGAVTLPCSALRSCLRARCRCSLHCGHEMEPRALVPRRASARPGPGSSRCPTCSAIPKFRRWRTEKRRKTQSLVELYFATMNYILLPCSDTVRTMPTGTRRGGRQQALGLTRGVRSWATQCCRWRGWRCVHLHGTETALLLSVGPYWDKCKLQTVQFQSFLSIQPCSNLKWVFSSEDGCLCEWGWQVGWCSQAWWLRWSSWQCVVGFCAVLYHIL